jgi:hypothetical protein
MPQSLVYAAVATAAFAAWRLLRREMDRVAERMAEVRVPVDPVRGIRLVRGDDGIWRPADRR